MKNQAGSIGKYMYEYTCKFRHFCVYRYMYRCSCIYKSDESDNESGNIYVHMCVYLSACRFGHVYIYIYICISTCIFMFTYACMCANISISTHMFTTDVFNMNTMYLGEQGFKYAGLDSEMLIKINEFAMNLKEGNVELPLNDQSIILLKELKLLKDDKKIMILKLERYEREISGSFGTGGPVAPIEGGPGGGGKVPPVNMGIEMFLYVFIYLFIYMYLNIYIFIFTYMYICNYMFTYI
jgi:hypothetical protein